MGRRQWGLAAIAGALLVAAVVPHIVDRTTAGSPRMAPSPGPPAIGNCVLEPVGGTESMAGAQPMLTTDSWIAYAAVPAVPCSGVRYGEVAHVIPGDQAKALAAQGEMGSAIDLQCGNQINDYLGLGPSGDLNRFKYWGPAANISTYIAGPSQLQAFAGQSWVACVVAIHGPDGESRQYEQSLRNMFSGGHLTSALSVCVQTTDPTVAAVVTCSQPHDEEFLATATGTPPNPAASTADCLALAKAFTGMPDPTSAGRLKVYVTPPPKNANTLGAVPECIIASTNIHHKLAGPLIDLGDQPVPWQ